jgi:hypothetical protein
MGTFTKDLMNKESLMALDNIIGKMVVIIKGTLIRECGVAMEFGKKERVFAINMKDNLKITKNRAMEFILGDVATYIKETIKIICGTVMDKCFGKMVIFIKETGN